MPMTTRFLAVPAMIAALSLGAPPAAAVERPSESRYEPAQATSQYGRGWGHGQRYRHRGRTTAGDVLGAVIVLGTIAAVANAATRANRERSYPYPNRYPYPDRPPYPERRDYRPDGPRGIEGAADMCLREIERDARVQYVTRVERSVSGWLVTGAMADGAEFTCSIGADGRIERIEVGGRARELGDYEARSMGGNQTYRSAEAPMSDGPQPAYPGGPLPGEDEDQAPEYDYPR